jgi:hypothetical protein
MDTAGRDRSNDTEGGMKDPFDFFLFLAIFVVIVVSLVCLAHSAWDILFAVHG